MNSTLPETIVVAPVLRTFIDREALPGTGLDVEAFWRGFADILTRFAPENAALLAKRAELQGRIDAWHVGNRALGHDPAAYRGFLEQIGYLEPEPEPFTIDPRGVDPEIAEIAGPQLVVPILNARFLLNAANARWGSLYDALYGTDAVLGRGDTGGYDPARGAGVVSRGRSFLDAVVPLAIDSWTDWSGDSPELADPAQLVGRAGDNILLRHNGLHIEIVIDCTHPIGCGDRAGIADILLEAAVTTICDLEDSVAAVDAEDKVGAYRNWLGLMRGDLEESFEKGGVPQSRCLNPDRGYRRADGTAFTLPGRSLLLVRNVGHLMTTPAVCFADGREAPEGIVDAVVTSLIGLHDLKRLGRFSNSRTGSVYIVKPKMHGPEEARFADALFDAVEDLLGLERHTIKIGVMDEERRTSANLAAVIAAVRHRVMFINTGFLDRTGDEIHTSMQAGPMVAKAEMRDQDWIRAYEARNVAIGLMHGFAGRAQIGKGMWAAPDRMADMLDQKIAHPRSGATTAWVPSPTAAVLHATHYHRVDVAARQRALAGEPLPSLDALLVPPVDRDRAWSAEEIEAELDNSAQGLLGYVVRWVDQGIGCSKVPDLHDVGLMEDRATLRISSQHIANWLLHDVCTEAQVDAALMRMAARVDAQNAADPQYRPMAGSPDAPAFRAARALIFSGRQQPSGYTEPLLHAFRKQVKAARS